MAESGVSNTRLYLGKNLPHEHMRCAAPRHARAHSFSAAAYLRQRQGGRHATTDRGHMANHLALQGTFHAMVRFLSRGLSMDKQDGLFWLDTLVARRNMIIIHR